jgi:hypothetical protein
MAKGGCTKPARRKTEKEGEMKKALLLLVPSAVALCAPLYNSIEPRLFGFPFLYWFLLLLVPISSIFTFLAYKGEKQ